MNSKLSNREYYSQYVNGYLKHILLYDIKLETLQGSKDPNFNDIPLRVWDSVVPYIPNSIREQLVANGSFLTLGVGVCILKEAARQLVEESRNTNVK